MNINKKEVDKIEKGFEIFFLFSLAALFLYMISNYFVALLLASALVFILYKPFLWLNRFIKIRAFTSLLMVILVLVLILVPLFWLTTALIIELNIAARTTQGILDTGVELSSCTLQLCRDVENSINEVEFDSLIKIFLTYISNSFESIFNSLTEFILNFFIFLFAVFFLFKDGEGFKKYLYRVVPIEHNKKNALFLKFRDISEAVFLNVFFVAIIQGVLTSAGLYFVGVSSPIFWGVIAGTASLLPIFGPALVWIPVSSYLLLTGDITTGIGLGAYGLCIIRTSDNIARSYLLKYSVNVHEFLVFIAIIGGIKTFGFLTGIFMGPLIISFLIAVVEVYDIDFK